MTLVTNVYDRNCPTRTVVGVVASHWGSLVLGALLDGTLRFGELRRAVGGISEKMLAQTLQALERNGLVHREVHPVIPPHVDYTLTALGVEASVRVRGLFGWIQDSMGDISAAQQAYDEARA
ncbi:helix-turn-helix domain-containing protein [Umezawaea sp. Da 62-37]|uniref:winged helix-turn-helix transcriptional regulator n=1 Tax=Umezawaea sp. Da 62-37 TaxID=3075927 RepID=UPI0028F724B5|nr:helix-turn-helix domain-containing protein [Umezawaea sp. Da 62-37]WNV82112.1 helix-turn-helix domain-containing protein [Umezawaea sp. Da 62-37]